MSGVTFHWSLCIGRYLLDCKGFTIGIKIRKTYLRETSIAVCPPSISVKALTGRQTCSSFELMSGLWKVPRKKKIESGHFNLSLSISYFHFSKTGPSFHLRISTPSFFCLPPPPPSPLLGYIGPRWITFRMTNLLNRQVDLLRPLSPPPPITRQLGARGSQ